MIEYKSPNSDAKTLVFVPGLLCDEALFSHQIEAFKDEYNIIVADITAYNNVEQMAQSVLANAPKKFILCALSMGGYVAMEILRRAPQRVTKVILSNTQAATDSDQTKRRRRGLISIAKIGNFKGVTPKLLPMLIHEKRLDETALTQTIMNMAERVGLDAFLNQQQAILDRPDSRSDLVNFNMPVLVVGGDKDQITPPEQAKEMAQMLPHSTLHIFETCGHLAPLEYPQQFTQLMRSFLT